MPVHGRLANRADRFGRKATDHPGGCKYQASFPDHATPWPTATNPGAPDARGIDVQSAGSGITPLINILSEPVQRTGDRELERSLVHGQLPDRTGWASRREPGWRVLRRFAGQLVRRL